MSKNDMQLAIEKMARNAAQSIINFTDQIAEERKEKEQTQTEYAKQYAYKQAWKNKYESLNYIKLF